MTRRRIVWCVVCQERPAGVAICELCAESFQRRGGDTHADHITWAARRTRLFERRRQLRIDTPSAARRLALDVSRDLRVATAASRAMRRG